MKNRRTFSVFSGLCAAASFGCLAPGAAGLGAAQYLASERWTQMANLNTAHELCAAVAESGKIYALGGPSSALEEFDPRSGRWTVLTNMATEREFFGLAALDHALFTSPCNCDFSPGSRSLARNAEYE